MQASEEKELKSKADHDSKVKQAHAQGKRFMVKDIEDLVRKPAVHGEDEKQLALNARTAKHANFRPTEVYLHQKGHWKRNIKRNTTKGNIKFRTEYEYKFI
jgi:hypothetical protein